MAQRLKQELGHGKQVLWLVSGGSNIPITVEVMKKLIDVKDNLTIMLTDERYGSVGHANSNWQQLRQAGLNTGNAKVLPTLLENTGLRETADHQSKQLNDVLSHSDVVIAQFGIGDDGHIAGILPSSTAATEYTKMATGYHTEQYDRITMTFAAIKRVKAAYCFVYGASKHKVLDQLQNTDTPLTEQPSQILKLLPEAYVYNDQLGSTV